ncbi:MAG: hypothetical protein QGG15_00060 [Dehalococcoidales bacterium]|jgi:hypothetical protein|nr:hypothetical protein [Dehalococcoidales bacterium]MDP6737423.1 hypothetical protein [Dehalococcoidales bacterium]|tara:strand:- start:1363 stop:1866 length:504 start_codon:yes stop_codon:yes gene_type:complete
MKRKLLLILVIGTLLLGACGASTTAPAPTEEFLLQRAEAAYEAFSAGEWLEYYEYMHPRFREECKAGEFAIQTGMGMAMVRSFMGVEENESLEWLVSRVAVEGEEGKVWADILYKGAPDENTDRLPSIIEEGAEDGGWVFLDGQWWIDAGEEGCPAEPTAIGSAWTP